MVRIITDSAADFTPAELEQYHITCIPLKVLFGEVPGVLLQVSAIDYEYLDSQLILQDVAYYPVGKPSDEHSGVVVSQSSKADISDILTALLAQASEGED